MQGGLYETKSLAALSFFRMGTIMTCFQVTGKFPEAYILLAMSSSLCLPPMPSSWKQSMMSWGFPFHLFKDFFQFFDVNKLIYLPEKILRLCGIV